MTVLSGVASALFWGVILLSLLVFVHESGHFLMARAFGVRVTEFFLGMPSRLRLSWKSRRWGTEFGVTPVLLGGYNRICGMEGELDDLLADALGIVQREGRVLASDLAAELGVDEERAYRLLEVLSDMGSIRPFYDPERDEHPGQSEYPAAFETLQRDAAMLTEYDVDHDFSSAGTTPGGSPRPVADAAGLLAADMARTYRGKSFVKRVLILLAGPLVNIALSFVLIVASLTIVGVEVNVNSNTLGGVTSGSLAADAGLKEGDTIMRLGSHDVTSWVSLAEAIDMTLEQGDDFIVAYERDGETFETTVTLPADGQVEAFGVEALLETYHPTFVEAASYALSYVQLVGGTIARLLLPQHTLEIVGQSTSIVGISAMASDAASSGANDLVMFAAAISMSLGFTNLLPVPPLDGGKILIEVVELVRRKPLSTKARSAVSYVGLAFFLFLFVFALRNDVLRIFGQ